MERHAYRNELLNMYASLSHDNADRFMNDLAMREKNPVYAIGFNSWLGWLGIDRFYVGDIVAGILKLITVGGLGIWVLIDWFLIAGRCRDKNMVLARQIYQSYR
ncbi:TM2 domain-containing protein [Robiginitomaculum antarcticum]|uniref:TM2 domain-containing protein n=1 Tax=Robiginitomaculum antarcticum TaxID=437507 RepID=UPI00036417B0|nr:TM2 domain-containing protein [Robiginitomaculum antarcticum]